MDLFHTGLTLSHDMLVYHECELLSSQKGADLMIELFRVMVSIIMMLNSLSNPNEHVSNDSISIICAYVTFVAYVVNRLSEIFY